MASPIFGYVSVLDTPCFSTTNSGYDNRSRQVRIGEACGARLNVNRAEMVWQLDQVLDERGQSE